MKNKNKIVDLAAHERNLKGDVSFITENLGYVLEKLVFVEENSTNYLRLTISHPDHPISLDDCEKVSREVDTFLENNDPIPFEYSLEVESPGIEINDDLEKIIGGNMNHV